MAVMMRGQTAFTADKRAAAARVHTAPVCTRVIRSHAAATVVCQAAATLAAEAPAAAVERVYPGEKMNRSYYPTGADAANVTKQWYIIDAEGKTLGRLASLAATYIRGKHSPTYTPSMDMGGYVIVINAEKVIVSGNKASDKTYFNHVNGRPGSYRVEAFKDLQQRIPERIIERAVKGMLPKGRLGRDIRLHLKAYKGTAHPHEAQQPVDITSLIDIKPKEGPGAKLLAEKKAAAAK